ncbi:MAG: hypothetical protein RLZZ200_2710, partial [Pseudomonadota bacterium]
PFEWHHHPEFELTLTLNSRGHRFVGDHLGLYDDGDLVLVGPNLPHSWCSTEAVDPDRPHAALVAWFSESWFEKLNGLIPEMAAIGRLLGEARRGVMFSPEVSRTARTLMLGMPAAAPDGRVLALLQVLGLLAADRRREVLASHSGSPVPHAPDARLQKVLDHLHANFMHPLRIDELAGLACLSPSALHRLFRQHTRVTPIQYAMQLRVGRACSLLMQDKSSIAAIAARVGYTNLANFNRQFRALRGTTPRQFRAYYAAR